MNRLRHHILFILFIAIAFSSGCDDNTASQNNNNPPQDTVFLASEFKKAVITYRNVLMSSGGVWSYDKSYRYRAGDGTKLYALSTYTNTTTDKIYGKTSFSGYCLKNSNEISELTAGYYSEGGFSSTYCYSLASISFKKIPFVYQQDSTIHLVLNGTEAKKYIVTIMDSNYYHQYPGWRQDEIIEQSYHRFTECTDSTQVEITLQK